MTPEREADDTPTAVETDGSESSVRIPGRYTVHEEIGRGGMGTVLRAHDSTLGRDVALKVLRALDARHIARLLAEAKAMARLSHPNVVHVYDVLHSGDGAVIVMELVRGKTLRRWLADASPTGAAIVERFVAAGHGLAAAHAAGLVHLDFKPSNVLLGDDGVAKVADFGLAQANDFEGRESVEVGAVDREETGFAGGVAEWGLQLTQHGLIAGTPRYMSPEQHRGERCGPTTDVYAYCVALWEALCGAPPFPQSDRLSLVEAKEAGPPAYAGPTLDGNLAALMQQALHPDPDRRPATLAPILAAMTRGDATPRAGGWRWVALGSVGVGATAVAVALATTKPRDASPVVTATDSELASSSPATVAPPLEGFGTDSEFGGVANVCTVASLEDSGPNSLRACIERHEREANPLRIAFAVGGTIKLRDALRVTTPHLTIDGLSAPAPGLTLASADEHTMGLVLADDPATQRCAHDVLVQGIRFLGTWAGTRDRVEQTPNLELTAREVHDCMRNIVMHRVTLLASKDAAGDMIGSVQDVTVQYSAFLRSHHPMELTNRPGEPLVHARISLHHNVFAYYHERSPQLRGPIEDVDLIQNVMMNWDAYGFGGGYAIRMRCRDGDCPKRIHVERNHWLGGGERDQWALVFGMQPRLDDDDGPIPHQVFMRDNALPPTNANFGLAPQPFPRPAVAAISTVAPDALVARMLPWVGAPFPTDVEQAVMEEVATRLAAAVDARSTPPDPAG